MKSSSAYSLARQQLISQYCASVPTRAIRRLIRGLTTLTDQTVQTAWHNSFDEHVPESLRQYVCLTAVGGYGRGDLLPNSDVDLLVLIDDAILSDTQRLKINTAVEGWLGSLWDMGLAPSHSVRTVAECLALCHDDLESETAALDARFLVGDQAPFEAFSR